MSRRPSARAVGAGLLVAFALLAASAPGSAAAQRPEDNVEAARALFLEGAKLGREGRWEEARQRYARSLELKPSATTRYSLGVAEQATGHLADALDSFQRFLAGPQTPASAPYQKPAREAVASLKRSLGQDTTADQAGPGGAPTPTAQAEGEPAASTSSASGSRKLPLILLGTGAALAAGGVLVGMIGVEQASTAATRDGADARAARAKGIAGDVIGGAGIATAAVGLVLLLTRGHPTSTPVGAVRPWVSGPVAGLELRL